MINSDLFLQKHKNCWRHRGLTARKTNNQHLGCKHTLAEMHVKVGVKPHRWHYTTRWLWLWNGPWSHEIKRPKVRKEQTKGCLWCTDRSPGWHSLGPLLSSTSTVPGASFKPSPSPAFGHSEEGTALTTMGCATAIMYGTDPRAQGLQQLKTILLHRRAEVAHSPWGEPADLTRARQVKPNLQVHPIPTAESWRSSEGLSLHQLQRHSGWLAAAWHYFERGFIWIFGSILVGAKNSARVQCSLSKTSQSSVFPWKLGSLELAKVNSDVTQQIFAAI